MFYWVISCFLFSLLKVPIITSLLYLNPKYTTFLMSSFSFFSVHFHLLLVFSYNEEKAHPAPSFEPGIKDQQQGVRSCFSTFICSEVAGRGRGKRKNVFKTILCEQYIFMNYLILLKITVIYLQINYKCSTLWITTQATCLYKSTQIEMHYQHPQKLYLLVELFSYRYLCYSLEWLSGCKFKAH